MSATDNSYEQVLSRRIRSARRSVLDQQGRRMSQQALADRLGVHVITVSSWERAKATPTVENLTKIARETGQPISHFLGDADDEEDERALRGIAVELIGRRQDDLASDLLNRVRMMKARREVTA